MKNILVSAIQFVNLKKEGSEIYSTFTKRLINDVLTKTPYDIMITTNCDENYSDILEKNNKRVFIKKVELGNHKTNVYAFNQLLKFYAIDNIDKKYDWVLYLDCDAGFKENIDIEYLESKIDEWEKNGYDMIATRTNATYIEEEGRYLKNLESGIVGLFDAKFKFYGIIPEWRGSCFPSEHVLLLKNNDKLKIMCEELEKFCTKYETQNDNDFITVDMEAFEIGVSSFIAGYKFTDMNSETDVLKVAFNYNNWEKIKR